MANFFGHFAGAIYFLNRHAGRFRGRGNAENNRARKIIALPSTGQGLVTDSITCTRATDPRSAARKKRSRVAPRNSVVGDTIRIRASLVVEFAKADSYQGMPSRRAISATRCRTPL